MSGAHERRFFLRRFEASRRAKRCLGHLASVAAAPPYAADQRAEALLRLPAAGG